MKIEFHMKDIVITSKQKSLIEKKLLKLKKYDKNNPMIVDVYLRDETGLNKNSVDQAVELSTMYNNEKVFIREVDDSLMRAFAFALKSFERNLRRYHKKAIDRSHEGSESYLRKALKTLKIKK